MRSRGPESISGAGRHTCGRVVGPVRASGKEEADEDEEKVEETTRRPWRRQDQAMHLILFLVFIVEVIR